MAEILHYNGYIINKTICNTKNKGNSYIYKVSTQNKFIRPFDKLKEAKEWIDTVGITFADKSKEQLLEMLFSKFSEYKNRNINHMNFDTRKRLQDELDTLYIILRDDMSEQDRTMIEEEI